MEFELSPVIKELKNKDIEDLSLEDFKSLNFGQRMVLYCHIIDYYMQDKSRVPTLKDLIHGVKSEYPLVSETLKFANTHAILNHRKGEPTPKYKFMDTCEFEYFLENYEELKDRLSYQYEGSK